MNPDDKFVTERTVELDFPIKSKTGEEIKSVTMRRPKVKDMITAEKIGSDESERTVKLIVMLTGLAPDDVNEMYFSDFNKLKAIYEGFLS